MAVDTPLLQGNGSADDIQEAKPEGVFTRFASESRKLWRLAGPAIFTSISQYSLGALTQTFAGQVSELDLAAVSVENSVIAGFAFGVMVPTLTLSLVFTFFILLV